MTLAQFIDWEDRQELRHEFDSVQPVAMTSGTAEHELIGGTLRALLRERLRGSPCRVWGPTIKIEVMARIRYPDAFVSCAPVSRGASVILDPVVIFEILSPATSRTDRIEKQREYQATPSVRRYVILEQDSVAATVFTRSGVDWIVTALTEADGLVVPEIGVKLALAEVYADVELFVAGEEPGAA